MYYLKHIKKVLSFLTCSAISLGIIAAYPGSAEDGNYAEAAKTIAEIQEQRKVNAEKIASLENKISDLEGDKDKEKQQQAYLEEQTSIIQDNINLLNAELEALSADIKTTETNIANLDADIITQQTAIDENIERFKERLCAMYMTGSDTSASIVLGSSSFYDMMSRVQMINSMAEYDDKLINEILTEIDNLETSKSNLETEKLSLTMKLEEQEKRKEEKTAEIEQLNIKMQETQYEIDRIALEQSELERSKEEIQEEQDALDDELAAIEAEIQRQAAEAQRLWEERQALLQQQQNNNNTPNVGGGSVPAAPSQPIHVAVTPAESGFAWPAPGFSYISSPFGARWGRNHNGIDIGDGGIMGGTAVASQAGTVITVVNNCTHNYAKNYSCGCGGGYGNYVVISHDGTYSTLYGHLTAAWVSVGDTVEQGQAIGAIGCTGHSTGAHLHFEIRVNGGAQNPLNYVGP
ncbi:MAG: peptidoglycan DD-metalloendopeptidase family protein [Ruminococcus sp.]|nr:peptidoglycan DD-metalloendopeptidase family protein [Ruminococcus sp.]